VLVTLFDHLDPPRSVSSALQVRAPKRPGGYAAQVGSSGVLDRGDVPDDLGGAGHGTGLRHDRTRRTRARNPTRGAAGGLALAAQRRAHAAVQVGAPGEGGSWQARPWLGTAGRSLNLGLWTVDEHGASAEWAAAQVAKAFLREWKAGRTVAQVVESLKNAPKRSERVPAHVEVPAHQRDLLPPEQSQPAKGGAKESRAERHRTLVTLADFFPVAA
jgi:hypothetical protein